MTQARRAPTPADVHAVPAPLVGELVAGELYASPRPSPRHARVAGRVVQHLGAFDREVDEPPGGWVLLPEPELHLGTDVLVPDLAGWRRSRLSTLPDTAALELAPDWILEVLAPSTARLDRLTKMDAYRRHRVEWAWLADRSAQTVEAYTLSSGLWLQLGVWGGDELPHIPPFDAVPLDLTRWWRA